MKTFDDLEFGFHKNLGQLHTQAVMYFDNGYGVSIVTGYRAYGNWEGAVLLDGDLCYTTPITYDVEAFDTEQEVTDFMRAVQELPKP